MTLIVLKGLNQYKLIVNYYFKEKGTTRPLSLLTKSLIKQNNNMDIGTLIQVVATIDAEIKSDRKYLASKEAESLSFEEQHAIEAVIFRYERLSEHFQGYIESMVSAMETAQGM